MDDNRLKSRTMGNMIWRFAERCGAQGVAFVVSLILARMLNPEVYGTVALLTVFTTILNVFVDSGLGNALIQKKDADQLDFSTVFIVNIVMCLALYLLLFIAAPLVADFYGDSQLVPFLRVLGLTLVVAGIKNIQQAYVSRHLMFKKFFFSTLGGTIIAAVAGIALAYAGLGAWALVVQQVLNAAVDTCILYITVKWRPHLEFSWERLRGLFSFGWKLLVSSLLDTVYNDVRQVILGGFYSSSDLAYYNQGERFPKVIVGNINTAIDSVLFPMMSQTQDEKVRIRTMTRRAVKMSTFVMAPMMMGLAFTAPQVVDLLLTDKWSGCVPYLIVFCVSYMFWPIHTANLNAIKAMGRSDLFLKLEIAKKIIGFVSIVAAVSFGPLAIAFSVLASGVLSQVINSWPNRRLIDYGYLDQLKDILPAMLLAVFMGICILPIPLLHLGNFALLALQVAVGVVVYIAGSWMFKLESFEYLVGMILEKIKHK